MLEKSSSLLKVKVEATVERTELFPQPLLQSMRVVLAVL